MSLAGRTFSGGVVAVADAVAVAEIVAVADVAIADLVVVSDVVAVADIVAVAAAVGVTEVPAEHGTIGNTAIKPSSQDPTLQRS